MPYKKKNKEKHLLPYESSLSASSKQKEKGTVTFEHSIPQPFSHHPFSLDARANLTHTSAGVGQISNVLNCDPEWTHPLSLSPQRSLPSIAHAQDHSCPRGGESQQLLFKPKKVLLFVCFFFTLIFSAVLHFYWFCLRYSRVTHA